MDSWTNKRVNIEITREMRCYTQPLRVNTSSSMRSTQAACHQSPCGHVYGHTWSAWGCRGLVYALNVEHSAVYNIHAVIPRHSGR
jgi:hypothetical protein